MEEMSGGGGELVATDESTVVAKPFLDAIVVEDSQRDGRLANSSDANESGWSEGFYETDDLLDQLVTSKEGPRWRWWGFSRYTRCKYKILDPLAVEIANLT